MVLTNQNAINLIARKSFAKRLCKAINEGANGHYGNFITLEQAMELVPIAKAQEVAYDIYAWQFGDLTILVWYRFSDDRFITKYAAW